VKAAAFALLAAAIFATTLLLGLVDLGSSGLPPAPIALHGFRHQPRPLSRRMVRVEIPQRVEHARISAYLGHDTTLGRR
jgi:hypothetical protein